MEGVKSTAKSSLPQVALLFLIVFLLLNGCLCSVSVPCGALDWSVVVTFLDMNVLYIWYVYVHSCDL